MPHLLTNLIIDNPPQPRHDDRPSPHTTHVDYPQPTHIPVVPPRNSDISVADKSRVSKHDPNDPDNPRLSDDTFFGFSFLDERRISKRDRRDVNSPVQLTLPPKSGFSLSDKPHITERSPDEEDDDQDNGQGDQYYTPRQQDSDTEIKKLATNLMIFKDAPHQKRSRF